MNIKLIKKEVSKGSQSLNYTEILKLNDYKIKIAIKSDAYLNQCRAIVEVFDNLKWNRVASIPASEMETKKGLLYHFNDDSYKTDSRLFVADRNELVRLAKEIIF